VSGEGKKNAALMKACQDGDKEDVLQALKPGRNLLGQKLPAADINHQDEYGRTPLMRASDNNRYDFVELLLEKGARIDITTRVGTALHYAARYDYRKIVELLLERGAPLDAKDANGLTPLSHACRGGYDGVVAMLLKKGADANAVNNAGETALMICAQKKECGAALKLLLAHGARARAVDAKGQNALMLAACQGMCSAVPLFLEHGLDINAKRSDGRTALMIAVGNKNAVMMAFLLDRGASIGERDNEGNAALHLAAYNEDFASLSILLERGADINARNSVGITALMIAAEKGTAKIVETLLERGAATDIRDAQGMTAADKGKTDEIRRLIRSHFKDTARPAASVAGSGSAALAKDGLDASQAEHWRPIGDYAIDHVLAGPDSPKILSNIFNFASRQYVSTCRNTATGLQEASHIGNLDDFPNQELVRQGRQKLLEMGKNPPSYGAIEKPLPAGLTKGGKASL
jgi:ankyrin repeat protein